MAFVIVHSCGVVYQRVYSVYSISITTRDHCATGKSHENSHERSHTNHHKFPWTIPLIFDLPMNSMVIFPWSQEKKTHSSLTMHRLPAPPKPSCRRRSRASSCLCCVRRSSATCRCSSDSARPIRSLGDGLMGKCKTNMENIYVTYDFSMVLLWFYQPSIYHHLIYPLVNCSITMENHNF